MKNYPETVNVLGVEYAIEYVDNPTDVDIFKRKSLWGQCDYWTRTIRIYRNERPFEDIWQTIVHEVIHAIEEQLKLKCFEDDRGHEELDILALALCDVMFRNGWHKDTK